MPTRKRSRKTAFVPKMVFGLATACVVPVCVSGCAPAMGPDAMGVADTAFMPDRGIVGVADAGFGPDRATVADAAFTDIGRDFGPIIALAMMAFDAEAGTDASGD